ncbi:manganese-dependent inorganic pyrophosphatase [Geothermobacter ehrlichii]|uniref:inorganic diphosphatase n=1 Tax=Geothermobacter ehrlichii TaxID=213224 RepID=A0A5D3WMJ7_9BACT|nr:putative manganese-dependent inorganic diphosphatase [Geothermobacter ehrlichii]TYO98766.1 manganese-dependent inorganic pyrophosphatase [Geothermobacter ehrlichii]
MENERVFVIGHRNPDTDSVCSAMAYARLLQRQGRENVQAARAGHLNRQTEFVLEELSLPLPLLLGDVYPRVGDVIGTHVITIDRDEPLSRAMELFHLHSIRQLPVVDGARRPLGLLVLKRITERFLVPRREAEIRRVRTSPDTLASCLRARKVCCFESGSIEELDLYVGAMSARTFADKMQCQDPRRMILVTGDRPDIQRQAVEAGVRVLVITGDLPVDEAILAMARERQVSVLSTSFDTATSAWLTRLATPVGELVGEECLLVGRDERVDEARLKLMHGRDPGAVVVDVDGLVCGILTKSNLLQPSPLKLILVDHNELAQAVPGADRVEILEVIDHHRLGNFHTDQPIRFVNQPLGSTCTVVATLYRQAGIDPEPVYAALMLAGLMSDTVMLKSPTTTPTDREYAEWLSALSGYDWNDFGRRMFQAGSSLAGFASCEELVLSDFKEFAAGEQRFGIGQVEVVSFQEFYDLKQEIEEALARLRGEKGLEMIGLLVTDIVNGTSLLLALGSRELPYIIGYPHLGDNLYELKNVLSRKKQLVPHLLKVLQG